AGEKTAYTYDKFGTPLSATDELGHTSSYQYDSENNLIAVTNAKGETARFDYHLDGSPSAITFFDGRSVTYVPDDRGRVAEVRDHQGELLLTIHRDEVGRIVQRVYPDGTEVRYAWGEQSQLIEAENSTCKMKVEWTPQMQIASEKVSDFTCNYKY